MIINLIYYIIIIIYIVNHFEGITKTLTTKHGFSNLLNDCHWNGIDCLEISPICYNLGDVSQRDSFIDEFRLNACINILKWYVLHTQEELLLNTTKITTSTSTCLKDYIPRCNKYCIQTIQNRNDNITNLKKNIPVNQEIDSHFNRANSTHPAQTCNCFLSMNSTLQKKHIDIAKMVCLWYLRIRQYGEWPGVDKTK